MASRGNEQHMKEAIENLLQSYSLKGKVNEKRLVAAWQDLMGKKIAQHTRKIYISHNKLFLTIDSAPLKQELSFARDKIVELVNERLGENVVDEVVIK